MLLFLKFNLLHAIDIFLVALLLFMLYRLLRGTAAMNIFLGIVAIFIIWRIVTFLGMDLLSNILNSFISVGFIAFIIVFQPEIRKFLLTVGSRGLVSSKHINSIFTRLKLSQNITIDSDIFVQACNKLSVSYTGALIIIAQKNNLYEFIETGVKIDANINATLLESIFYKNNPLHDGAVIVGNDRIVAARCILPVSSRMDIPQDMGLRHRSALGITERSDAIAIVVSEQTGQISYFKEGKLFRDIKAAGLKSLLENDFAG